ncbi:MAG: hypothetical protein WHT07_01775 [Desulfobaccales bacterium]
MIRPHSLVWPVVPVLLLTFPRPSLALISHGHPEGLYVHQLAHLLFAGAMIFLIYMIKREGLQRVGGFRTLIWAGVLYTWWNLLAFAGHTAEVFLSEQAFVGRPTDFGQRLLMDEAAAWVYYVAKMDHLILVPAFYLFYRGLKALTHKPGEMRG